MVLSPLQDPEGIKPQRVAVTCFLHPGFVNIFPCHHGVLEGSTIKEDNVELYVTIQVSNGINAKHGISSASLLRVTYMTIIEQIIGFLRCLAMPIKIQSYLGPSSVKAICCTQSM